MRYHRLSLTLSETELEYAIKKYHFQEQKSLFLNVYHRLVKQCQSVLYYEYEYSDRNRMIGLVSLGYIPDRLLEEYQAKENFLAAFAVECLSLELLSVSYQQTKDLLEKDIGLILSHMEFCDQEDLPMILHKLKSRCKFLPVTVNDACALSPSKSVLFYGTFGKDSCLNEHICTKCDRVNCIFRTGETL